MPSKRALVTGASGFVGRHCLGPLLALGFEVHAVSTQAHPSSDGVTWHVADLLEPGSVRSLMEAVRPTHLLHFAWYVEPGKYLTSPLNYDWIRASMSLVTQFAEHGGKRVVGCGTGYEYDGSFGYCSEVTTPTVPATLYGSCKLALSSLMQCAGYSGPLSVAWGRAFFLYGPHEQPGRLASSVILAVLRGEAAKCSHGRQVRDYMHVQDVANGFVALLASDVKGAVNISSGRETTIAELVTTIGRILERPDLVELGAIPPRADDLPLIVGTNRRLVGEVGWKQRYELESGLRHTIDWWRTQVA